jgi:putative ATP-dependent endonuclease of the OLD family
VLHGQDEHLPDLGSLEANGRLLFIPAGGDLHAWADRLAALPQRQFFLFDRETVPTSDDRATLVRSLNQQPGRVAFLTSKRATGNYLHAAAVLEATGMVVEFDDHTDLPELLAQKVVALTGMPAWERLSRGGRNRMRNRVKKVLNTAADLMTTARLAERDPRGDVAGWMRAIADLLSKK